MDAEEIIRGKRVLLVDDEKDVLETISDILSICKIDMATSFEEAKTMLEKNDYDIAVLDIMGVNGYELLEIAKKRNIPALMLTAHALSREDLKRSAKEGAAYYAPKDKMEDIPIFIADVLEGIQKKKSPWQRVFDRLGAYYDTKFGGPDWREKEKAFWEERMRHAGTR